MNANANQAYLLGEEQLPPQFQEGSRGLLSRQSEFLGAPRIIVKSWKSEKERIQVSHFLLQLYA